MCFCTCLKDWYSASHLFALPQSLVLDWRWENKKEHNSKREARVLLIIKITPIAQAASTRTHLDVQHWRMGKNLDLKICLSRPSKHYHPGDVVTGECALNLSDYMKLRFLSIEFQGESWTYWEEMNVYTTTHKNAEIYFHKKSTLFGNCKYWTASYSRQSNAYWVVLQSVFLRNFTFTVCKCCPSIN